MQDSLDDLDEIDAAELQRRDVDGHHQIRPRLAIDAGATQHPVAEIDDQSAVLRDSNELARRDLAAGWMLPTAERLDADDLLAALVDDGLIYQLQAVVIDCFAQIGF